MSRKTDNRWKVPKIFFAQSDFLNLCRALTKQTARPTNSSQLFTVVFYGARNFCRKTAQFCVTHRES